MYNKEELQQKDIAELVEIARSLNIAPETIESEEEAIEKIIMAQETEATQEPVKRTRKRVLKKDTTDHVYSVNGTDGENLDTKQAKRKAKAAASIFVTDIEAEKKPKRRTKKAAEKEEEISTSAAEAEDAMPKSNEESTVLTEASENTIDVNNTANTDDAAYTTAEAATETENGKQENTDTDSATAESMLSEAEQAEVPEAAFEENSNAETPASSNLIAQLQAKMNSQNENGGYENPENAAPEIYDERYWEGDPGDGTDFIIIEDLPIEDAGATMSYDIFDNPTTVALDRNGVTEKENHDTPKYDFSNIIKTIGLLEIMPENYGFIRSSDYNYLSSPDDVFVPMNTIRRLGLKTGDMIECTVCPPASGDKYFTAQDIQKINGRDPQEIRDRIPFEHLTPLFPKEKFNLCGNKETTNLSTRIVDLFSPIGKGQRALIVAQPKTGKTMLMKDIANAIAASHPEAYLMMLLIDERPEEVTDMARTVNAEVIASTFDEPADRHVKIAGLVLEKAKRMVECGHDVVIFLDSITRLARAYNTVAPASGKVLTGGVDANALQKPKRFFGAARNIEDGGSLTIISTALIDTGSKMDEVIFEEFKGTGNMELQLDRAIANKRIFPAINLIASSTRRDDLLIDRDKLDKMWILRRYISDFNPVEAMNEIKRLFDRTTDNEEFIKTIKSDSM